MPRRPASRETDRKDMLVRVVCLTASSPFLQRAMGRGGLLPPVRNVSVAVCAGLNYGVGQTDRDNL